MRALVIGASGQVGAALLTTLRARGHEARGTYGHHAAPGLEPLDLADHAAVTRAVAAARPDWVFCPAGLSHVDYCEDHVDEKIKQLLRELGAAINEAISSSDDVNRHIQRIRDEGFDLYVVLDATIGLNKHGSEDEGAVAPSTELIVKSNKEIQFRINVNDLALLRSLGIDPTRKVRHARRVAALQAASDE